MIQNIPSIIKKIDNTTSCITGLYLRKHESIRNTTPTAIKITTAVTIEATSTCINLSFSFDLSLQLLF